MDCWIASNSSTHWRVHMSVPSTTAAIGTAPGRIITLEEGWEKIHKRGVAKLQSIIVAGLNDSFTNQEYVDLYTTIYQMCIQKNPHCYTPQLYDRFSTSFQQYLLNVALPAITNQTNGEFMVREFVKRWEDHKLMKQWMCNFFKYLDRFYVKRHNKKPLQEVAINKFRTLIFDGVKTRAVTAIGELVTRDRHKEEVDRDLLRDAIQIWVDMGMGTTKTYQTDFEAPFIAATGAFYAREAASWLATDSCPDYLRKAELRIAQERKRLKDYLHSSSEDKLMETLYQSLLLTHQSELLNKEHTGCKALLRIHAESDLARMFSLYSAVPPSLEPIARTLKAHITEVGNALIEKINADKNDDPFIEELMKIHDKYHELVSTCFKNHAIFHKALKEAFEAVVNVKTFKSSTAELLAEYSDNILKKGGTKLSEKALQTTLDNLVRLFTYLSDKDIFSEFYRKKLSNRLLLGRSASDDAEKSMISKLKLRCGAQYTSKFEGMINDMRTAADHNVAFKDWLRDTSMNLPIDFTVQTLTSGFWPTYAMDECKLPPQLSRCCETFKAYYNTKTNNRKLMWIHNLGVVTMSASFAKRKVDLVLSGVQATILMLFNEQTTLTVEEIQKHTQLPADTLKRQLRSLASGKYKLVQKKPSDGYANDHLLRVNMQFVSPQRVIRIPNASSKTSTKERKVAQTAVTEDRRHAIEANIVRIMKSRKTLTHQQLVAEVTTQLMQYFQPDPKQIKKRIEDLIARDYLERDADKSNVYHYLA